MCELLKCNHCYLPLQHGDRVTTYLAYASNTGHIITIEETGSFKRQENYCSVCYRIGIKHVKQRRLLAKKLNIYFPHLFNSEFRDKYEEVEKLLHKQFDEWNKRLLIHNKKPEPQLQYSMS